MNYRLLVLILFLAVGCSQSPTAGDAGGEDADIVDMGHDHDTERQVGDVDEAEEVAARFATFNVSMYRSGAGELASDLADPAHEQARAAAAILQEARPDVVLLNEFDWDPDGEALRLFRENFLEVSQGGRDPIVYEYAFIPEVNTGVASGVDLDGNGTAVTTPGSEAYGNDSLGFGEYPGQYGLVVLSRFPIAESGIRTFRTTLWKNVPENSLPDGHYSEEALAVLPLSSKTHADVPIEIGRGVVHFLVSHPAPPSFDGPEDRNGRRNHDEIVFWRDYVDAGPDSWHIDDSGIIGGLDGAAFVIAGDLNADPNDGDSTNNPATSLLAHPRVNDTFTPSSAGGQEQAELQGNANVRHDGDPAHDTADFNDNTVGNLRIDYVLPSTDLEVAASGVFWPSADDPNFDLVGTFPFPVSDHRLVWVDVAVR